MITDTIIAAALTAGVVFSSPDNAALALNKSYLATENRILASESLDLSKRHPVKAINDGFKENILINLNYLQKLGEDGIIILFPNEVFAFHKNLLPEFKSQKIITQESGFMRKDGYKTVAGLQGNGVCHLASLMKWVAVEAGLEVTSPVNHDFAPVPGIDRQYGVSIYFLEKGGSVSERQNLYIKNIKDYPIYFHFSLEGENLKFSIEKAS